MNDVKNDIERIGETASRRGWKVGLHSGKFLSRFSLKVTHMFRLHFTNPMKAIEKDGSSKRLAISPPLTKEEAKAAIAKAREQGILVCLKEMTPDGEQGRGKSIYNQRNMAKNEIKAKKWLYRSQQLKSISPISAFCKNREQHYKKLSRNDNVSSTDKRYIVICNESRIAFMNDVLEDVRKLRLQKQTKNELVDINKDGVIDEKDISGLETLSMDIEPEKLETGKDYGSCMIRDYHENYCIQTVPKEEYCSIRNEMFNLRSHGAYVLNNSEVLLAFPKADLKDYLRYGSAAYPIHEYGKFGGNEINKESNHNNLISLEVENAEEMDKLRNLYKEKDYIAALNSDGSYSVLVKEKDTESLVDMSKKKSSTASLLEEAREFVKQQEKEKSDDMFPDLALDSDKELEHDY